MAAAESSIISSDLAAEDGFDKDLLDLSEKHLAYFVNTYKVKMYQLNTVN